MLPFDDRPWAKTLATIVIVFSVIAAIATAFYLENINMFHFSEMLILALLLLTIVPPNLAIILRKPEIPESMSATKRIHQSRIQERHAR
jgi:hypothetical protein